MKLGNQRQTEKWLWGFSSSLLIMMIMNMCPTGEAFVPVITTPRSVGASSSFFVLTSTSSPVMAEVVASDDDGDGDGDDDDNSRKTTKRKFMFMTPEQDRLLTEIGSREASLMTKVSPLRPHKIKSVRVKSSSGGFGGGGNHKPNKKKKNNHDAKSKTTTTTTGNNMENEVLLAHAKAHAKVLQTDGIVRIDNVLTPELADALKAYLVDLRARATADIESGRVENSQERFADVLLNQNRCDLKIPFGPEPVMQAMHHLLNESVLRPLIEHTFDQYNTPKGPYAKDASPLYELNCFMSNSGARRQLVHADNVCSDPTVGLDPQEPIMLTCFVALQDTDETMGPTVFIPGTHNTESHRLFYENDKQQEGDDKSTKDELLGSSKCVMATLPKGACAIFDPRTLHCAGGNNCADPEMTRAMFYFSFKNPKVDNPGCPSCSGYGIANAEIPMGQLCDELNAWVTNNGQPHPRLDIISCFP